MKKLFVYSMLLCSLFSSIVISSADNETEDTGNTVSVRGLWVGTWDCGEKVSDFGLLLKQNDHFLFGELRRSLHTCIIDYGTIDTHSLYFICNFYHGDGPGVIEEFFGTLVSPNRIEGSYKACSEDRLENPIVICDWSADKCNDESLLQKTEN